MFPLRENLKLKGINQNRIFRTEINTFISVGFLLLSSSFYRSRALVLRKGLFQIKFMRSGSFVYFNREIIVFIILRLSRIINYCERRRRQNGETDWIWKDDANGANIIKTDEKVCPRTVPA